MAEYVIGVDLGTSSLKSILIDRSGNVIAEASSPYDVLNEHIGYSEQDPEDWYEAFEKNLLELCEKKKDILENLKGISFSGQMHSLVLLDENKEVLRKAILWNDTRTTNQCQDIMEFYGEELLYITKNQALEGFTLPKILWVQENEPDIWERVRHILLPKDYLRFRLTGKIGMDYSDASGTLLLDLNDNIWSTATARKYKIPIDYLPELLFSHQEVGLLEAKLKEKFKFSNDIHIFAGGADNACSALGAGILDSETGLCSIGTSGVVLGVDDYKPELSNGELHYFKHVVPDFSYSMGVTLAAGSSLAWYRGVFAKESSFEDLLDQVDSVPLGADGMLFTPYIDGERTPYVDSKVRGSFIGIDRCHTFPHFTRAVIEGITFSLKDGLDLLEERGQTKFNKIVSVGGGAKNHSWLQIQADIFNKDIFCLEEEQGPAMGAAMLAAIGLGWYQDYNELAKDWVKVKMKYSPIDKNVKLYNDIYAKYHRIYKATKMIVGA